MQFIEVTQEKKMGGRFLMQGLITSAFIYLHPVLIIVLRGEGRGNWGEAGYGTANLITIPG